MRRYRARVAGLYVAVTAVTVLVLGAFALPAAGIFPPRPTATPSTAPTAVSLTKVTLTPESITMEIDEERELTATAEYSDESSEIVTDASWTSSDTDVAKVSKRGTVTARAAGTATITAEVDEVKGSASVTVTRTPKPTPTLESISVLPAEVTLQIGKDVELEAEGTFSDNTTDMLSTAAIWSSENEEIASVDGEGNVTALAEGRTTITANEGTHSGTAEVEVVEPTLEGIVLQPRSETLAPGETVELTLTANYSNNTSQEITDKAKWKTSDDKVAQVEAGLVDAVSAGREASVATITATWQGLEATADITVERPPRTSPPSSPDTPTSSPTPSPTESDGQVE
jgi:uncharacterized protein YjdB